MEVDGRTEKETEDQPVVSEAQTSTEHDWYTHTRPHTPTTNFMDHSRSGPEPSSRIQLEGGTPQATRNGLTADGSHGEPTHWKQDAWSPTQPKMVGPHTELEDERIPRNTSRSQPH
ncbi:hypothetical protein JTB14_009170 [Gonioctena quinquepunctata]|nr:hypothetical protein JTB14_009170 [Gonioctena quinquepunctata]